MKSLEAILQKAIASMQGHPLLLGFVSLAWLALRTGTKPTRISYPCQRAALANSCFLLTAYIVPFLMLIPDVPAKYLKSKKVLLAILLAVIISGGAAVLILLKPQDNSTVLEINPSKAKESPASKIFIVNGVKESDCYEAVRQLISLMGSNGLFFYRSESAGLTQDPSGLISSDDVVIVKVNGQWSERGGTNTDLVKALIQFILEHPDGFTGEIVICDNGQGRGSLSWSQNNAENRAQSFETLAEYFSGRRVSTYLWDRIADRVVREYDKGDLADGYVLTDVPLAGATTNMQNVSYPKFRTKYGTYISFNRGVWQSDLGSYNSSRLKVLNVPVLKSHSGYLFTGAIKHYMGVVSQTLTNAHSAIGKGAMGTEMANTRYPILNILDAIWINPRPGSGPATSYADAVKSGLVMASRDPIALDTWAAIHVLSEVAVKMGFASGDAIRFNPVGSYLKPSMEELRGHGYDVTMDESHMDICVANLISATNDGKELIFSLGTSQNGWMLQTSQDFVRSEYSPVSPSGNLTMPRESAVRSERRPS